MSEQIAGFCAPFGREEERGTRLLSAPAYDWIYLILILLAEVGFTLDVWSHTTYGPDQSVLSEYHLLMYGGIAVLGAFLTYTGASQMREGASWRNALPAGFSIGFLGVLMFGISGVIDLIGHALFGFESGTEAKLSPSHMGLFVGFALLQLALPQAAGARQRAGTRQSWVDYVPTMISIALLFQIFNLVLPDMPMGGQELDWPTQAARGVGDALVYNVGIGGTLLVTSLYIGLLVGCLRVMKLPVGSITLISMFIALLMLVNPVNLQFIPVWLAAGISGDLLLLLAARWIKDEAWTLRLFGLVVPIVLWGGYFASLILTNTGGGVWWSGYIWTGTVAQTAAAGFVIAALATLPAKPLAKGDTP